MSHIGLLAALRKLLEQDDPWGGFLLLPLHCTAATSACTPSLMWSFRQAVVCKHPMLQV